MSEVHSVYPFSIRWEGGKRGVANAPGGLPEMEVATPPEFGGPGGRWTPEHLFVGAAASCWLTTFLAIAELSKLELVAVDVAGEGSLVRGDDRRFSITRIVLRPRVTLSREEDREKALRLIGKAEDSCLVTRSMRTEVVVEPDVAFANAARRHWDSVSMARPPWGSPPV
jgi:peroxiredoxin-like protein